MYISKLIIENYKSIKSEEIEFKKGINVLVGKNNSGKSNIVSAINEVLGEKTYDNSFEEKIFFTDKKGKTEDYFKIVVEIDEINTDLDCSLIKEIKKSTPVIDVTDYFDETNFNSEWLLNDDDQLKEKYPDKFQYNGIGLSKFLKTNELIETIENTQKMWVYKYINRKEDTKIYSIILKVKRKESVKYYRLIYVSNKIKSTLITSLLIPTFRSPELSLKISKWTWYGKLLQKTFNDSCNEDNEIKINDTVNELKECISVIYKGLEEDLNLNISNALNLMDIIININMVESKKEDYYKSVKIAIDDGVNTPLENKGSGMQSIIIIELFKYYCKLFNKNSLIVLEEPELFLHPHARRMVFDILMDFVYKDKQETGNQIILTTHSEEFVKNIDLQNIILIKKENGETKKYCINKEKYEDKELQKIKVELLYKNTEMFFAEKVILVEGEEVVLLPLIIKEIYKKDMLNCKDISVIKVGGKTYFKTYKQILDDLKIDNYIIADYDIIQKGIEDLLEEELREEFSKVKTLLNNKNNKLKTNGEITNQTKSMDWNELSKVIDNITENKNYDNQLEDLWKKFKDRIIQKNKLKDLDENDRKIIINFIDKMYDKNIFIMKNGELEDYYKKDKMEELKQEFINLKKGLKTYKITELSQYNVNKVSDFIDISEYREIMNKIFKEKEKKENE